jgi:hypothetical protein
VDAPTNDEEGKTRWQAGMREALKVLKAAAQKPSADDIALAIGNQRRQFLGDSTRVINLEVSHQ